MTKRLEILGKVISESERPFVIAEISGNHNGDIERAYAIIDAAVESGADAVKLQTYPPETMTLDCDRPDFQIKGGLWDGYSLFDLYEWAHTHFPCLITQLHSLSAGGARAFLRYLGISSS